MKKLYLFVSIVALLITAPTTSYGFGGFLSAWRSIYPNSTSANAVGCALCHDSAGGGNPWNAYGWQIRQAYYGAASFNISTAIRSVEANDADGDGSSNEIEIIANTLPGWTHGNNNTHFFKNNTTSSGKPPLTIGNPPTEPSNLDPRKILAWLLGQGLRGEDATDHADPDRDGASNLVEYLMGGLANDGSSMPQPQVLPNGRINPSFVIDVRIDDPDYIVEPEWSHDLINFSQTDFTSYADTSSRFGSSYVRRRFDTTLGNQDMIYFRAKAIIPVRE